MLVPKAARRQSCFPFRQSYHGENVPVCPLNHRVNYRFVLLLVACYLTHAVIPTFLDVELFRMFCPDRWYAMLVLTHRWSEAAFFLLFLKKSLYFSAIFCCIEARWLKDVTFSSHWSFGVEEKECARTDKSLTRKSLSVHASISFFLYCPPAFFLPFLLHDILSIYFSGNLNPHQCFKVGFGKLHHAWRKLKSQCHIFSLVTAGSIGILLSKKIKILACGS